MNQSSSLKSARSVWGGRRARVAQAQRPGQREQRVRRQHRHGQPRHLRRARLHGLGESLLLVLVAEQIRRPGKQMLTTTTYLIVLKRAK